VGIGLMFVVMYGFPKLVGGVALWQGLGGAFNRLLGVAFLPAFWGFLATVSEFCGGLCVIAGVFFRPACALMLFTMIVAVASIIRGGYGINAAAQPLALAVVLLSLFRTGPGKTTLSNFVSTRRR